MKCIKCILRRILFSQVHHRFSLLIYEKYHSRKVVARIRQVLIVEISLYCDIKVLPMNLFKLNYRQTFHLVIYSEHLNSEVAWNQRYLMRKPSGNSVILIRNIMSISLIILEILFFATNERETAYFRFPLYQISTISHILSKLMYAFDAMLC